MKGFNILTNGHLEKVRNGSTTLNLLARGSGIELMKQTVVQGSTFMLFPGDQEDAQEFFYILAGEVEAEVDGGVLRLATDDFFSCKNLESAIHFTVLKEVTFLSVSTIPVFHYLSNMISELRKIGEAVEKKDRYTFNHSSRVANYSVKTAAKMKLGKDQIENLFLASILHDIGKINIPEEVLKKPTKLTNDEFKVVKKHPSDGADMIRKTAYADLANIVEQHHERVDGSGYPFGLVGEEILIEARIIGVCDTFDAMTEDRAYRSAFSSEYAMTELKSLIGAQYDEDVVRAFEQVLKEEGKLSE